MLVFPGPSDEAKTSSNASANIMERTWIPSERKDAVLREESESIRSLATSTSLQDAVSAVATCTSTISTTTLIHQC